MARDTTDIRSIETVDELVDYLAAGNKPRADWRIGTEHEKFPFYADGNSPVPYGGEHGIKALLEGMQRVLGWEPIIDAGNIIGLVEPTGCGAISLEPGGQFELSGAPLETLHQTCREGNAHLAQLRQIAEPLGIRFLGLGGSPKWTLAETPKMPKSRYDIMTAYMPKVGRHGLDMMYRTCTIQVNLDFSSEADMRRKMQVSLKLQPLSTALFANSPFTEGAPNGLKSWRGGSGATPTISAPACCRSAFRPSSVLPTMSNGRSTCRCISSSATAATTTAPTSPSASSWTARSGIPFPTACPPWATGPTICRRFFPMCA